MSSLIIRKLPFEFDDEVPFVWQPGNPSFSMMANAVSFLAIGFEKYIVTVIREAMPLIGDPALREEAELFLRQEAQHASAHRRHVRALIQRYPALADTLAKSEAQYDKLLEEHPIAFHLGYIADVEATFTSFMKMMLDHKAVLFDGGDDRIASLFIWHFIEEMEHRSSALAIYRGAIGREWYRIRILPEVMRHSRETFNAIVLSFDDCIPQSDRLVSAAEVFGSGHSKKADLVRRLPFTNKSTVRKRPSPLDGIPRSATLKTSLKVLMAELPYHDPGAEKLPSFAAQWHDAYDTGHDVTTWYASAETTV